MFLKLISVSTLLLNILSSTCAFHYPLHVESPQHTMEKFLSILNNELPFGYSVEANQLEKNNYGIYLKITTDNTSLSRRQGLILSIAQELFASTSKSFKIKLVEGYSTVLIGNVRSATFDIADILKFENISSDSLFHLSSANILLHELYEQYFIQVKKGISPAKACTALIRKAHNQATQKESNLFSFLMEKTGSSLLADSLYIEFTNRNRKRIKIIYSAYHRGGNITEVRRIL